jgi:uncharacterized protein
LAAVVPPPDAGGAPAPSEERISAVDVLRGVAVLGILLINIEDFGLLHSNKSAAGTEWVGVYLPAGLSRGAVLAWTAVRALFEGKMRAIFSMLFGAGAVLLTARLQRRDQAVGVADIYYRRTLWLLVFGILHAYLLWEGDILYSYALCGLFLFPFRRLPARRLILLGALALSISLPRAAAVALHRRDLRSQATQASAQRAAGLPLTSPQESALDEWDEIMDDFQPDPESLRQARADYLGGYLHLFRHRAELVRYVESSDFYGWAFFDGIGMMLIGMGLLQAGFITATRSRRLYLRTAVVGYGVGLPISAAATYLLYLHRFDPVTVAWLTAAYDPGRIAVALGHISVVMLVVKAGTTGGVRWLTRALGDVGRMALTSYLGATIICTTLFNGYGFGLFGSLRRHQLYLIVLGIWCAQLLFSRFWLARFRFGPVEWCWRSLTYARRQPMRLDLRKTGVSTGVTTGAVSRP